MNEEQLKLEYPEEVDTSDPQRLMVELCECIDQFNKDWPMRVIDATVFRIPLYEDGLVPEKVIPECVSGGKAVELSAKAF